jgi:hypothetical protein
MESGDDMIENLPLLAPNSKRREETIAHCHARLAARRRRDEARKRPPSPGALGAERLIVAGLCVVYLITMADNLLTIALARGLI